MCFLFDSLFNPNSVAVIGASSDETKIGNVVMRNLIEAGFEGNIYPVNPRYDEILGLKSYPSLSSIGDEIDIAVITLPAKYTLEIVKECIENKVKFVIEIAGGFSETGDEGRELQKELEKLIRHSGMRVIGPNTVGVYFPHSKVNTALTPPERVEFPPKGDVAFISQSGALGLLTMDAISEYKMGISAFVNLGNRIDVNEEELLDYFLEDKSTRSIVIYLESIPDGKKFYDKLKKVNYEKPVVILKAGRTVESAKAASLHTGAMATNDNVLSGALKQAGVVRAYNETELLDFGKALAYQRPITGKNIAVITTAGGVGVITADYISSNETGPRLNLAPLSDDVKSLIKNYIVPFGSSENPIDITADGSIKDYENVLGVLSKEKTVDAIIAYALPQTPKMDVSLVEVIEHFSGKKPIVVGVIGFKMAKQMLVELEKRKIPAYPSIYRTVKATKVLYAYGSYLKRRGLIGNS